MNIWRFQASLTRRLLVWAIVSMMVSVPMIVSADPFWRGVGMQFVAWGAVDAAIAVFGVRMSAKKQAGIQESNRAESEAKEARWLERVLWINTCLDVLYVLGGVWLARTWGAESPLWRGHGIGVVIQGGFLFFFDFYHAWILRNFTAETPSSRRF